MDKRRLSQHSVWSPSLPEQAQGPDIISTAIQYRYYRKRVRENVAQAHLLPFQVYDQDSFRDKWNELLL